MVFRRLATIVSFLGVLALSSGCNKEADIRQIEIIEDAEKQLEEVRPLDCSNALEHLVLEEEGILVYEDRDESTELSKIPQNTWFELCSGDVRSSWQLANYNGQLGWIKQGQEIVSRQALDNESINIKNIMFCSEVINDSCLELSDLFLRGAQKTVSFSAVLGYQNYERREIKINGNYQLLSSDGEVVRSGEINLEKELSEQKGSSGKFLFSDEIDLGGLDLGKYTLRIELEDTKGELVEESGSFVYNDLKIKGLKICKGTTSKCSRGETSFLTDYQIEGHGGARFTERFLFPDLSFSFSVDTYQERGTPNVNVSYLCEPDTQWRNVSTSRSNSSYFGQISRGIGVNSERTNCQFKGEVTNSEFPSLSTSVEEDFIVDLGGAAIIYVQSAYGNIPSVKASLYEKIGNDYRRIDRFNINNGSGRLNLSEGEYKLELSPFTCLAKDKTSSLDVPAQEKTFSIEAGDSIDLRFKFKQCYNR
ncbi:MAG: hypothetical protein ABIG93_03790 [archaeon]|nr:hypothetical protein [Nanoarchaeota archaeon]